MDFEADEEIEQKATFSRAKVSLPKTNTEIRYILVN